MVGVTKRYRDDLDEVELAAEGPRGFRWRGRHYEVLRVLGHWHEEPGWWSRVDGTRQRIARTDLWRVEARNGTPSHGIYELVERDGRWRLDRVWD